MKNLYYAYLSICENYKWWISVFLCLFIVNDFKINKEYIFYITTFILTMMYSQTFHYLLHMDTFYPINIVHVYHHSVSNNISYILEILYEILVLCYPIIIKYLLNYYYGENKEFLFYTCRVWAIVLYIFFYITMHNINYSILKVNHIHRIHHDELFRNLSPDIFDILFYTKTDITDIENTDHMVINLYVSLIVVIIIKKMYELNIFNNLHFIIIISILLIIKIIASFILFIKETDYVYNTKLKDFKNDYNKNIINKNISNYNINEYIKEKFNRLFYTYQPYLLFTECDVKY